MDVGQVRLDIARAIGTRSADSGALRSARAAIGNNPKGKKRLTQNTCGAPKKSSPKKNFYILPRLRII
jgi:hypothetical protein